MFEIERDPRMNNTERLLFNIYLEQKKTNSILMDLLGEIKGFNNTKVNLPSKEIIKPSNANEKVEIETKKEKSINKVYDCKYCGGTHEKPQQIAACAKKNKGGNKKC